MPDSRTLLYIYYHLCYYLYHYLSESLIKAKTINYGESKARRGLTDWYLPLLKEIY